MCRYSRPLISCFVSRNEYPKGAVTQSITRFACHLGSLCTWLLADSMSEEYWSNWPSTWPVCEISHLRRTVRKHRISEVDSPLMSWPLHLPAASQSPQQKSTCALSCSLSLLEMHSTVLLVYVGEIAWVRGVLNLFIVDDFSRPPLSCLQTLTNFKKIGSYRVNYFYLVVVQ